MADELSSNRVTFRYNEEKLLDLVAVRRSKMMLNQLEGRDEVWSEAEG